MILFGVGSEIVHRRRQESRDGGVGCGGRVAADC